ncbi:MAG: EAL domain-containing response regulator [Rhodospirillaceae bacterium]
MNGLLRILIVDDDDLVRRTLAKALERFGAAVTPAASAAEALRHIATAALPFTVIFCDLHMPDRDGVQLLRDLAAQEIGASIVLLSGMGRDIIAAAENTARHHGLNVLGHLTKPFDRDKIAALVLAAAAAKPRAAPEPAAAPLDVKDIVRGIAGGEFGVVFQPKVRPADGVIDGVESLARWAHPIHGTVSPGLFIPLAEDAGIIDALTEAIVLRAFADIARLRQGGLSLAVSVNLSTLSMTRLNLPDDLHAAALANNVDPSSVTLEVTESRIAERMVDFLEISTRLRMKGFKLSIDDFGTGFSTLEQIARLPISEIKMDRSLVAGTPANSRTSEILRASLEMGRKLGLNCVCEGVETKAEWSLVRDFGTDSVQGYFVARPMTADALVVWVRSRRTRAAS